MSWLGSLSELLFPSRCLGCKQLGIHICSSCRAQWNCHIYRSMLVVQGVHIPVYSAVLYSDVAQKVLLGSKESSLLDADILIRKALRHALTYINSEHGIADLVPIPSQKSASRKRGRDFMVENTKALATQPLVEVRAVLEHRRRVRDQSRLSSQEREINLRGAFRAANTSTLENIPVIIVDDLITTGTTLHEAARALISAGYDVIGAVTACVAKPLRYTQ